MRIGRIFLAGVLVLLAVTAAAEYYRYTDENGKIRFTDDVSQIPKSQRNTAEKFESVSGQKETPQDTSAGTSSPALEAGAGSADKQGGVKNAIPAGSSFETRAAELNRIQERLHKTRQALEKERTALEAQAPGKGATSDEKVAYSFKVEALNAKVDAYQKELKAFEQKVEELNNPGKGLER